MFRQRSSQYVVVHPSYRVAACESFGEIALATRPSRQTTAALMVLVAFRRWKDLERSIDTSRRRDGKI